MCNKIHIYLVDEDSLRWLIVNEYVGERFTNNRYTGRFIIKNWNETDENVNIRFIGFDGTIRTIQISNSRKLKISRKLKLSKIQGENNDFYTYEEQVTVNRLRFDSLKSICNKNKYLSGNYSSDNSWYWNRRKPNRKSSRTQKRQKLAKENRSNNKSKNR